MATSKPCCTSARTIARPKRRAPSVTRATRGILTDIPVMRVRDASRQKDQRKERSARRYLTLALAPGQTVRLPAGGGSAMAPDVRRTLKPVGDIEHVGEAGGPS